LYKIALIWESAHWLDMSSCQVQWQYSHSPTFCRPTYNQPKLDQNFLKKISVQTTLKMLLKFHFELRFYISFKKLCCCCCCCYFATKRLLIWIPLDLPEGVYFTPISYCRLKTNAIYDLVFRTYPVRESGRTRKQSGVNCKSWLVIPCVQAGDDHYRLCLLNMVAICSFEKLLPTCQTARSHRGDGNNMKLYDTIKLVSYFTMFCFCWVVLDENSF
jgi:hypothetical protein